MRTILSEKNLVVVLFVMVLITFSLAHEDTKKMGQLQNGINTAAGASVSPVLPQPGVENISTINKLVVIPAAQ